MDSNSVLSTSDHNLVRNFLWPIRHKWFAIGGAMEIEYSDLKVIEMNNNNDVDRCFMDIIAKWLSKCDPVPCWKNLAIALERINIEVFHQAGIEHNN